MSCGLRVAGVHLVELGALVNAPEARLRQEVAAARQRAAAGQPCSPRRHMGAQLLRGEGWTYGGEYKDESIEEVSLVPKRTAFPALPRSVGCCDLLRGVETSKASAGRLGAVLILGVASANHRRRRPQQCRIKVKVKVTKRPPPLPPLPMERELELKKNINRNAAAVKWTAADRKRWRFAARGGRWQEAIALIQSSDIPLEAEDYQFVITACVRAGAYKQAVHLLLKEMKPVQLQPDALCFSSVIHAVEHLQDSIDNQKEALEEVLKMAPKLDAKGFAAVLAACQRFDIVEGLDFLKTALDEQIPLTEASYVHGINLCVPYGKWELSLEVLNQVVQLGIVRELDWKMLGTARQTCLQAGQWQKVLELSEKRSEYSEHSEQDAYGYAAQMIALERLGQLQQAYHLFKEMVENWVAPNQHVYAALIGDGSDENAWQNALHLLEDSRLRSVSANQVMFGKAINCCVPAIQWEAALCLLRDMDRTCGVSCVALSSALRACGEGLQWQRALGLLHAAPKLSVEQDANLWNFAIFACGLAGKGRMAEKLLRSMKAKKVMPSLECYHSTLNAMGCDAEDRFSENAVERLLHLMQKEGLEPTTVTLNAALGVSVQKGRWQEALALGQRLRKRSIAPSEVTYGELISACKESRQWQVALSLLEASLAEDSTTSVTTFNIAISVCESSGKLELAIRLLRRIQELGLKPDVYSYNAVLAACQDAGDWQMGLAVFEEMKKQSIMPDIYSYGAVILSCSMAMQWEWAVNLWHQMESQGLAANSMILSSVAGVCSRCGQQAWVDYLLAEMRRRGASLDNNAFSVSVDLGIDAGAVAAEEEESDSSAAAPVAKEQSEQLEQLEQSQKLSGASLKVFMEKVEGASKLYMEALKDGAFTPWVRPGRLLDLHGMSTEVAKVAVYVALSGVPDLEEDDLAFVWGLKIIVGKGIHSKDNQVVLEPVVRELLEDVFKLKVSETIEGAFRVYWEDLWAIKCEGVWPPKWLKEGKKPPKAWLQRRQWLPELPQSLQERRQRIFKRMGRIGRIGRIGRRDRACWLHSASKLVEGPRHRFQHGCGTDSPCPCPKLVHLQMSKEFMAEYPKRSRS
eukprot:s1146_g2.t1